MIGKFSCYVGTIRAHPDRLQGVTRAMQGPTLEDLKDQAGIELGDFAVVFGLGTISFPLGNLAGDNLRT